MEIVMDRRTAGRRGARLAPACWRVSSVAALLLLAACAAAPTQFSSTWIDHTYDGPPVRPVAVLALFKSEAESRNFEARAVERLGDRGVQALAGHSVLAADRQYTPQQMQQELRQADVGGVLIFRLIGEDRRHEYVNPAPYLGPMPPGVLWGDPFYWYYYPNWNYYWYWRSSLRVTGSPGYWAETSYYVIESSLYDNKTNRLLWTAKSETLDGRRLEAVAESVADRVADKLVDLGFLQTDSRYAAAGKGERSKSRGRKHAG